MAQLLMTKVCGKISLLPTGIGAIAKLDASIAHRKHLLQITIFIIKSKYI